MIIQKFVCEVCGKDVADRYDYIGWIHICGGSISVSKGRRKDRSAVSDFIDLSEHRTLDFCSWRCFCTYLRWPKGEHFKRVEGEDMTELEVLIMNKAVQVIGLHKFEISESFDIHGLARDLAIGIAPVVASLVNKEQAKQKGELNEQDNSTRL